jgi:hypothetical protein
MEELEEWIESEEKTGRSFEADRWRRFMSCASHVTLADDLEVSEVNFIIHSDVRSL